MLPDPTPSPTANGQSVSLRVSPSDPDLLSLLEQIRNAEKAYKEHLPYPGLWDRVLLPRGEKPVRPPAPGDAVRNGSTVATELGLARDKAVAAPRIAMVGEFSTGKSTLVNAILHSAAANKVFQTCLGMGGDPTAPLLPTADQVCTGNITQLEFTGQDIPDPLPDTPAELAKLSEQFEFSVTYLTEDEMKDMIRSFASKLEVILPAGWSSANDWHLRLHTTELERNIEKLYDETKEELRHKDLRVLWEIIVTLATTSYREALGQKDVLLGHGKEGLKAFRDLLQRPALDPVPSKWKEVKLYTEKFHMVKFLRFRLPHSDFPNLRFSLFDFPGLGAGLYRDEHISRGFIAEANVIMVLIRPGRVGGTSVTHILESFTDRREQLPVRDILRRIYFVFNGQREDLPRDDTLVPFYVGVFQMVRNYLGRLLARQPLPEEERRDLLRRHLSHFIAVDGRVGGYLRWGDGGANAERLRGQYEDNVRKGAFDCPTDLATLKMLSENPKLRNETDGYPILADLLADPLVGKAVAEIFSPLKDSAGMPNLLKRIQRFVETDGPSVQADDVRMHLKLALEPLKILRNFDRPDQIPGLEGVVARDMKLHFDRALAFEEQWGRILDGWATGERQPLEGWPKALDVLARLEVQEAEVVRRIEARAAKLINIDTLDHFRRELEPLEDNDFPRWLKNQANGSAEDDGGWDMRDPTVEDNGEKVVKVLRQDHTLVLYRYLMQQRQSMMRFFAAELLEPFLTGCIGVYLEEAGSVWAPVNQLWERIVRQLDAQSGGLHEQLKQASKRAPLIDRLLKSMRGFLQDNAWPVRKFLRETLLPVEKSTVSEGQFFDQKLLDGRKIRLLEGPLRDKLPATSAQLSVFLTRIGLLPIRETDRSRLQAETLPDFERDGILQILKAIGLVEAKANPAQLNFADEGENYWSLPLPVVDGKAMTDGLMYWNPVPFDPVQGKYDPRIVSRYLNPMRDHLILLFSDLAVQGIRILKGYWKEGEQKILPILRNLSRTEKTPAGPPFVLWQWLNENSHLVEGTDPLEERIKALQDVVAGFQANRLLG